MLKILQFHQFQEVNRQYQQMSKWFPRRRQAISWCHIRETRISSDVTDCSTNCVQYCVTQNQSSIITVSHCTEWEALVELSWQKSMPIAIEIPIAEYIGSAAWKK